MRFYLADGVYLSAIGPGQDWKNDPLLGPIHSVLDMMFKLMGKETGVAGDGVDTWEVSLRQEKDGDDKPYEEPMWMEYLTEMSNENWSIYGHVPTDVVVKYIADHGGDPKDLVEFVAIAKANR